MSSTPQDIANVIGATQAQYQAGRAERTKDFQNLLNDVKKFTYGDDDAFNNIAPGSPPKTVNLAELNPFLNPADAELEALKLRPPIDSFIKGSSFGQADKQRAKEAGYTNQEIRQWKKEKGYF